MDVMASGWLIPAWIIVAPAIAIIIASSTSGTSAMGHAVGGTVPRVARTDLPDRVNLAAEQPSRTI